jgi:hypothetical protein
MQRGFRAQRDKTPFDKLAQAFARTRLGGWLFVNVFPVIDRRLIPLTSGRPDYCSGSFRSCLVLRRRAGGVKLERPQPRSGEDERAGRRPAAADHRKRGRSVFVLVLRIYVPRETHVQSGPGDQVKVLRSLFTTGWRLRA